VTQRPFRIVAALAALCLFARFASAAETIPPKPERYFNDYAQVVSAATAHQLNEQLAQFERDTSNQIVVAAFPKFPSDSSLEDFAQRTYHEWGVGQKANKGNGAILFVFVQDHKMRIHTGYGLEGALPDITCREIIANVIAPRFKAGDYDGGFRAGVNAIIAATKGEYHGSGKTVREQSSTAHSSGSPLGVLPIFFILVIVLMVLSRAGRRRGYSYTSSGGGFTGGFLAGSMFSGGSSSGGGWSGGGSAGGGDSGFSGGGGDSGGGGASGSW
jgi:uncharacterized protein